jgi:hypothetical protein
MLNAIPDKRSSSDIPIVFIKSTGIADSDHEDEIEEQEKRSVHEAIDLGERRKSSVYSGHSDSTSSVEVPPRNAVVDMGKNEFFLFQKKLFRCFGKIDM